MKLSRTHRFFSVTMALFVLSVALMSRVPTSKCRCHERRKPAKQQQQQSTPCVFGQLRSLAASIVVPAGASADLILEFNPFHDLEVSDFSTRELHGRVFTANARAPPNAFSTVA
jgi:hypothetical protein